MIPGLPITLAGPGPKIYGMALHVFLTYQAHIQKTLSQIWGRILIYFGQKSLCND